MGSYENVKNSLVTQLQSVSGFSSTNVTHGKITMLTTGVGSAMVVNYSRFEREEFAFGGESNMHWYFDVDIYIRFKDEAQIQTDGASIRQAVLNRINQYPKLGGTANILNAVCVSGAAAPQNITIGDLNFYKESISVRADEDDDYTPQE